MSHIRLISLLTESPDNVYDTRPDSPTSGKYIECCTKASASIPFGWHKGKIAYGEEGWFHGDLSVNHAELATWDDDYQHFLGITYGSMKDKGRIWPKHKILSFYKYPPPGKMAGLVKDISKAGHLKIDLNKFYVDPPQREIEDKYKEFVPQNHMGTTLITVAQYIKWGKGAVNQIAKIAQKKTGGVTYANRMSSRVAQNFYKRYGLGDGVIKFSSRL